MSTLLTMHKEKQTNFTNIQQAFRSDLLPSHLLFININIKMQGTSAPVVVSEYVKLCLHMQQRAYTGVSKKGRGKGG